MRRLRERRRMMKRKSPSLKKEFDKSFPFMGKL
jgi:hypothetical protein